jgi:hypothetical protein
MPAVGPDRLFAAAQQERAAEAAGIAPPDPDLILRTIFPAAPKAFACGEDHGYL